MFIFIYICIDSLIINLPSFIIHLFLSAPTIFVSTSAKTDTSESLPSCWCGESPSRPFPRQAHRPNRFCWAGFGPRRQSGHQKQREESWVSCDTGWWKKIPKPTTWDVENPVNNGINYQPQLVSQIFSINSMGSNTSEMLFFRTFFLAASIQNTT